MILSVKEKYVFIPKFNDNERLPESKRVRCEIIRPTADEVEELTSLEIVREFSKRQVEDITAEKTKGEGETPGKKAIRMIRKQDTGRILREHVGKISNLEEEIEDEKGKKTIRSVNSGVDLAESKAFGITKLIDEICAEVLRDKLPEDTGKNSESASSST